MRLYTRCKPIFQFSNNIVYVSQNSLQLEFFMFIRVMRSELTYSIVCSAILDNISTPMDDLRDARFGKKKK